MSSLMVITCSECKGRYKIDPTGSKSKVGKVKSPGCSQVFEISLTGNDEEKIAKTVEGTKNYEVSFVNLTPAKSLKEPKYKSVGDILKQRALAENRPEQALGFISREKELIDCVPSGRDGKNPVRIIST